jgi:PAS domain S-box-containing protein
MSTGNDERKDPADPAVDSGLDLRRRAGEKAAAMETQELESLSPEEAKHLVHELRVHQIELEMQNEELRRTQQELEASRTRYFDLYDVAPVGYVTVSEPGAILEANLTAATLLGVPRVALVNRQLTASILPADQDIYYRHRKRLFETREPQVCELRLVRPDGKPFWARLDATVARDGATGPPLGRLTMSDITERRQAEAIQRQTQEQLVMASRLASLGRLASGVAHEINNPLTVVIGGAQMLMERDIPEDIREDLFLITDSAQCVAGIVQGLLVFARQSAPGREYVNINALLSRVLRIQAHEMKIHDIEVTTRFAPDLPWTMVDVGQIQQVFLNTIVNADQAMVKAHNGGHFLIKTEQVDDFIRVTFKDDGVGIAKEDLPKLFDPFFTTKAVGEGVGLGLSISYGIIQAHNGRIYARGKPGKGATFVVELPIVAKTDQPESPEEPAKEPERTTGRILVVDDEPSIRRVLARSLTREGHLVETIGDADAALEKLKQERFGAVLLDIRMSDLNGKGLYECLGEIALSLQKRVVFITRDTLDTETQDFLDKTKVPCICQPFDIQQLRKSLDRVLMKE